MAKWIKLILIGILSAGAFTLNNMFPIPDWYFPLTEEVWTLSFQAWNIAEILFYLAIGMAFWLLWRDRKLGEVKGPALYYASLLIIASAWSVFFFGEEILLLAFFDALALVIVTGIATYRFMKFNRATVYLMVPCIIGALLFTINNFRLYLGYANMF